MNTADFFMPEESLKSERLHYKDCGLDNIYLLNGFERETHDGDEYVSITDIDELHRAIGIHIVLSRKAPSNKEIRFLRNEMDMSQSDLGKVFGVTDQSVARWEKGQTEIPGPAVFSLKLFYLISLVPEDQKLGFINDFISALGQLGEMDETDETATFCYGNGHWKDKAA